MYRSRLGCSSRFVFVVVFAVVQFGVMPSGMFPLLSLHLAWWSSSGHHGRENLFLFGLPWWKACWSGYSQGACFNKLEVNLLAGDLDQAIPFGFSHHGGGSRTGSTGSGDPRFFMEASSGEGHQQRQACAAASSGQRDHFAPRSFKLRRVFFLHADEPNRRIFISSSTAFFVGPTPSGLVPGGSSGGRASVALQQRRWTRLRSLNFFEALFVSCKEQVVILFSFGVLHVICTLCYE